MKINELSENFFASICEHGFVYDNEWVTRINPSKVDFILRYKKGDLKLTEESEEECKNSVIAMLMENEYKYNRLTASLEFEYNPIENYNMSETIENTLEHNEKIESENETVNGEKKETITDINGERIENISNSYGEKIENVTNDIGQRYEKNTDSFGQLTTTTNEELGNVSENVSEIIGEENINTDKTFSKSSDTITKNDETENRKNAFDVVSSNLPIDNTISTDSSETLTKGERTENDITNIGERKNSVTKTVDSISNSTDVIVNDHIDTHEKESESVTDSSVKTLSACTDTTNVKNESYTDTKTLKTDSITNNESANVNTERNEKQNQILNRNGNIGVTTTQQMIVQEREVALFSFYNILINDILDCIAVRIWEI